jgi:hypothetical protein
MRLQAYRDENHSSRHWSIDVVAGTAAGILGVGFACSVVALWVY